MKPAAAPDAQAPSRRLAALSVDLDPGAISRFCRERGIRRLARKRPVDLHTPFSVSRRFREQVVAESATIYEQA